MTTCKHADSGCNYPEGECVGVCMGAVSARYFKPSPGPWRIGPGLTILDLNGAPVARLSGTRGKYEPEEVNGFLIESAPDLLEAGKQMLAVFQSQNAMLIEIGTPEIVKIRDDMRAAITKATRSASHG